MSRYPVKLIITDTHVKNENQELVKSIFKQFFDLAVELGVDGVHMGDAFTYRSAQSLSCLLTMLDIIISAPIDVDWIEGNHDKPDLTKSAGYMKLYASLNNIYLHEEEYFEYNEIDKIVYCYLSYFKEGAVYLERLLNLIEMIKGDKKAMSFKKVLFTHTSIDTVRNNDGSLVEGDHQLKFFDFFDLVLSGHYHEFQELSETVIYIGASHQANYGENEYKGFTVLYNDLTIEHVQSEFPAFKQIYIDASDKTTASKLLNKHANTEDNVRFIFQGNQADIEAISATAFNDAKINVKFENTYEAGRDFEDIGDAELIRFDKKSLGKYWLSYCQDNSISPEQKTKGLKLLMSAR